MESRAVAGIFVSLCALTAVCDSGHGHGNGNGDGSSSGGASGSQDAGRTTPDASGVPMDSAPSDSLGADAAGGRGDDGGTGACGTRSCDADLEYCRVSIPGTGGMTGYSCIPRKGCESCDCIATDVTCTCNKATGGFITLTCRGQ